MNIDGLLLFCLALLSVLLPIQGKGLYFTTASANVGTVGWCDLDKFTIPTCTPQNAMYLSGWGTYSKFGGAVMSDSKDKVYVFNTSNTFPQYYINVWEVKGSQKEISVKQVANISTSTSYSSPPSHAILLPDHIGEGHDAIALVLFDTSAKNQTFVIVDAENWKVIQTIQAPTVPWNIYGGALYFNHTLIFGSAVGNLSEFNGTVLSYNFITGEMLQTFICTPQMEAVCAPRAFAMDPSKSIGYFSTGWEVWSFPLENPSDVNLALDLSVSGDVNGVFGGGWFYDEAYWYGDAMRSVNFVQMTSPPKAIPTHNSLGSTSVVLNGVVA